MKTHQQQQATQSDRDRDQEQQASQEASSETARNFFNYVVPIGVAVTPPCDPNEPNKDAQQRVRSITWCLVQLGGCVGGNERSCVKWRKTIRCRCESDQTNGEDLELALAAISDSLGDKLDQCALLTSGPLSLRQQLQPIARRLKSRSIGCGLFQSYIDLSREFERSKWAPQANCGRQVRPQSSEICQICCQFCAASAEQQCATQAASCCENFYLTCQAPPTTHQVSALIGAAYPAAGNREHETALAPQKVSTSLFEQHLASSGASAQMHRLDAMLSALAAENKDNSSELLQRAAAKSAAKSLRPRSQVDKCAKCAGRASSAAGAAGSSADADGCPSSAAGTKLSAELQMEVNRRPNDNDEQDQDQDNDDHCLHCALVMHNEQLVDSMCAIVWRLFKGGHQFGKLQQIRRQVQVGLCNVASHEAEQRVVRARGLPWQATEQDIGDFFAGLNIAKGGVGLCLSRQGRRNGEALVQFENREHRNLALARHKHFMGQRYIEVYRASAEDFQQVASVYSNNRAEVFLSKGAQAIVRMRGLPFTCTAKQVVEFFASTISTQNCNSAASKNKHQNNNNNNNSGANNNNNNNKSRMLKPSQVLGGEEGVLFVKNSDEKPTGDAFVLFSSEEDSQRALAKHHENIGTRYVELFRSSISEVQQVLSISSLSDSQCSVAVSNGGGVSGQRGGAVQANVSPSVSGRQANQVAAAAAAKGHKASTAKEATVIVATNQPASSKSHTSTIDKQRTQTVTYAQVATSGVTTAPPDTTKSSSNANVSPPPPPAAAAAADKTKPEDKKQTSSKAKENGLVNKKKSAIFERAVAEKLSANSDQATPHCEPQKSDQQEKRAASSGSVVPPSSRPLDSADRAATTTNSEKKKELSGSSSGGAKAESNPLQSGTNAALLEPSQKNKTDIAAATNSISSGSSSSAISSAPSSPVSSQAPNSTATPPSGAANKCGNSLKNSSSGASTSSAGSSCSSNARSQSHTLRRHHHHHHHHHNHRQSSAHYNQQHHLKNYNNGMFMSNGGYVQPVSQAAPPAYQMPLMMHHHQHASTYPHNHAAYMHHQPYAGHQSYGAHFSPSYYHHYHQHHQANHPHSSHLAHFQAPLLLAHGDGYGPPTGATLVDDLSSSECRYVRLTGLPFEAQIEHVLALLGKHSENVMLQGVHMVYDAQGQPTGEAIIQMNSAEAAAGLRAQPQDST